MRPVAPLIARDVSSRRTRCRFDARSNGILVRWGGTAHCADTFADIPPWPGSGCTDGKSPPTKSTRVRLPAEGPFISNANGDLGVGADCSRLLSEARASYGRATPDAARNRSRDLAPGMAKPLRPKLQRAKVSRICHRRLLPGL